MRSTLMASWHRASTPQCTSPSGTAHAPQDLAGGYQFTVVDRLLNAPLDDFRIYRRALKASEVTTHDAALSSDVGQA